MTRRSRERGRGRRPCPVLCVDVHTRCIIRAQPTRILSYRLILRPLALLIPTPSRARRRLLLHLLLISLLLVPIPAIIALPATLSRKVTRRPAIFFAIMAHVPLDDVVDIGRAILVQLDMMSVRRLVLKDDNRDVDRA